MVLVENTGVTSLLQRHPVLQMQFAMSGAMSFLKQESHSNKFGGHLWF